MPKCDSNKVARPLDSKGLYFYYLTQSLTFSPTHRATVTNFLIPTLHDLHCNESITHRLPFPLFKPPPPPK